MFQGFKYIFYYPHNILERLLFYLISRFYNIMLQMKKLSLKILGDSFELLAREVTGQDFTLKTNMLPNIFRDPGFIPTPDRIQGNGRKRNPLVRHTHFHSLVSVFDIWLPIHMHACTHTHKHTPMQTHTILTE